MIYVISGGKYRRKGEKKLIEKKVRKNVEEKLRKKSQKFVNKKSRVKNQEKNQRAQKSQKKVEVRKVNDKICMAPIGLSTKCVKHFLQ